MKNTIKTTWISLLLLIFCSQLLAAPMLNCPTESDTAAMAKSLAPMQHSAMPDCHDQAPLEQVNSQTDPCKSQCDCCSAITMAYKPNPFKTNYLRTLQANPLIQTSALVLASSALYRPPILG